MNDAYKGYAYDYLFAVAQASNCMDDVVIADALLDDFMLVGQAVSNAIYRYRHGTSYDDMDDY